MLESQSGFSLKLLLLETDLISILILPDSCTPTWISMLSCFGPSSLIATLRMLCWYQLQSPVIRLPSLNMGALCEVVPTGVRSCLRLKQSSLVRPSPWATFVVKGPFLVRFCFLGFYAAMWNTQRWRHLSRGMQEFVCCRKTRYYWYSIHVGLCLCTSSMIYYCMSCSGNHELRSWALCKVNSPSTTFLSESLDSR